MNGMAAWVRILIGAVWLNGALEKLLSPSPVPSSSPQAWTREGSSRRRPRGSRGSCAVSSSQRRALRPALALGGAAPGARPDPGPPHQPGSGGQRPVEPRAPLLGRRPPAGDGARRPRVPLNVNLLVALVSLVVLLSPAAKAFSLDNSLARCRPRLTLLLTNRRASGRTSIRDRGA